MAVYVDDMRAPFGRLVMCHMVADTSRELLAMADRIGVERHWIQQPGTAQEHFDICLSKRALAVRHGAIEITMRDLAAKTYGRRDHAGREAYYEADSVVPAPTEETDDHGE